MTDRQIFGWTPPNPPSGMVGYVAAHYLPDHTNHWPADFVRLTVRPHGQENPPTAEIAMPRDQALNLADMIVANAHPTLEGNVGEDAILKFFAYEHLPEHLQPHSRMFALLAQRLLMLPRSAERTVALRKLLEAKDAGVRAALP